MSNARSGDTLRAWVQGAPPEKRPTVSPFPFESDGKTGSCRAFSGVADFATDLNPRAIAVARRGVYPATINQQVPAAILKRYFTSDTEGYQVVKKIRDMVIFAPHNLLFDPPFSRLDILSCRNLLIYLAPEVHASAGTFSLQHEFAGIFVAGQFGIHRPGNPFVQRIARMRADLSSH